MGVALCDDRAAREAPSTTLIICTLPSALATHRLYKLMELMIMEIRMFRTAVVCAAAAFAAAAYGAPLQLHHIQVIGTHNSYHLQPPPDMAAALSAITNRTEAWDYSHAPLDVQLDRGVRSFELDIHPFVDAFEVMHVPIVDEESTCRRFHDCLTLVAEWSKRHPKHIPISFLLEFKLDEALLDGRPLRSLDASMLEELEEEIAEVFPLDRMITPDDVRGDAATLTQAVRERGWPALVDCLGKVFFVLHNRRELRAAYTQDRPSLEGRLMFVNSSPERADAAFIVVDNPHHKGIPELRAMNLMIRVRADSGLSQGRTGDISKREAAFASGAQVISTDFPPGQADENTGYVVAFPNGAPARCVPVDAPDNCEEQLQALLQAK